MPKNGLFSSRGGSDLFAKVQSADSTDPLARVETSKSSQSELFTINFHFCFVCLFVCFFLCQLLGLVYIKSKIQPSYLVTKEKEIIFLLCHVTYKRIFGKIQKLRTVFSCFIRFLF